MAKKSRIEKAPVLHGVTITVDAGANNIIVRNSGRTKILMIDPKAIIRKAGKTIALSSLGSDEKVDLHYQVEVGKDVVTLMNVVVSHAGKPHASRNQEVTTISK
jgi:hypothetical protein